MTALAVTWPEPEIIPPEPEGVEQEMTSVDRFSREITSFSRHFRCFVVFVFSSKSFSCYNLSRVFCVVEANKNMYLCFTTVNLRANQVVPPCSNSRRFSGVAVPFLVFLNITVFHLTKDKACCFAFRLNFSRVNSHHSSVYPPPSGFLNLWRVLHLPENKTPPF